jgi:lipopolysaccharide/colanic/teichoic acid biosynthesis glycosyltransferase
LQEETELYGKDRDLLLSCKPGLTGLWQVQGRSNVSYENGQRQAMELKYVRERSLWLDIKILFMTVGAVVRMDGAR